MSRNKRTSLSRSIADLAANMPAMVGEFEIPETQIIAGVDPSFSGDDAVVSICEVSSEEIKVLSQEPLNPGGHCDHVVEPDMMVCADSVIGQEPPLPVDSPWRSLIPPSSPEDLFRDWSRTPEGYRVTDTRIPTDPIRLGSILDDNARMAFMAGYAAANPGFE